LYSATQNNRSAMFRNSTVRLTDIFDGTSSTIVIVECAGRPLVYRGRTPRYDLTNDQGQGWIDSEGPFRLDGSKAGGLSEGCGQASGCVFPTNQRNDNEPFSFHSGGVNLCFADGHVQFLREGISLECSRLCALDRPGRSPTSIDGRRGDLGRAMSVSATLAWQGSSEMNASQRSPPSESARALGC
jgi:prepilin-type processing-associated H-X9-DG protein